MQESSVGEHYHDCLGDSEGLRDVLMKKYSVLLVVRSFCIDWLVGCCCVEAAKLIASGFAVSHGFRTSCLLLEGAFQSRVNTSYFVSMICFDLEHLFQHGYVHVYVAS